MALRQGASRLLRPFQPFTAAESVRAFATASANGVPVEVGAALRSGRMQSVRL